jgi:hypothetical protein
MSPLEVAWVVAQLVGFGALAFGVHDLIRGRR